MNYELFKMKPAYKDYIWGGTRLKESYHKESKLPIIAESWEVSTHPDGLSEIVGGSLHGQTLKDAIAQNPALLGEKCKGHSELPLLVKLIDAREPLSLQVHPNDEYARRMEGDAGKNEMWYIVEAGPGAELILGFERDLGKDELRMLIESGDILSAVRRVPVKAGDCYTIPAGMLHSIGEGILLIEVQQTSNVTYRVYDYGRVDSAGKRRELHISKALDVLDTTLCAQKSDGDILANWEHFTCRLIEVESGSGAQRHRSKDSFECLVVADICRGDYQSHENAVTLKHSTGELLLQKGESVFIPAGFGDYTLKTNHGTAAVISTSM